MVDDHAAPGVRKARASGWGVTTLRRVARPARRVARQASQRLAERRDPALGWLMVAIRRQRSTPEVWAELWDNRRRLVRSLAPGRSFLDLGGMFGVDGEVALLAEQSGATRVVLFDGMDPSDEFADRYDRSESRLQFVQGDLHDPDAVASLGQFDVVWCTGVIYHSPNPMLQLAHLRQMTKQTLVMGSLVIPEIPGIEQACILYPGISTAMQDTFANVEGGRERFPGMAAPFDTTPLMAYANMWWGISPSALRSMLNFSGFEITDEYHYMPFCIDLVARPGGISPSIYPPFEQSRERVRQRHADTPADQLPAWANEQMGEIRGASDTSA